YFATVAGVPTLLPALSAALPLLHVDNTAPTASFAASTASVDEGGTASVAFSNVSDPSNADSVRGFLYSYDFDNDGTFELLDTPQASVVIPAQFLRDDGVLTIHGRLRDQAANPTDLDPAHVGMLDLVATVTVREVVPMLHVSGTATVAEGAPYHLALSASDPGADTISHWTVDWNDGIVESFDGP